MLCAVSAAQQRRNVGRELRVGRQLFPPAERRAGHRGSDVSTKPIKGWRLGAESVRQ